MANVLITTLGKGTRTDRGYKEVRYRMPGGETSRTTPFIGMALIELLPQIDRLVILGTVGSIWDAWWQGDPMLLEGHENLFAKLEDAVNSAKRDEESLAQLSEILGKRLQKAVECRYIPDGLDQSSQLELLNVMDSVGSKGDNVYLDVTHGFRYLPMMELLSAFLNKGKFHVKNIFYGAFEKSEGGITPVVDVCGLLNLQEWIEAIAVFRETGSVMPLARIPSMDKFRHDLEQYQFFVQMNNVGNARGCANRIRGLVQNNELPPEGSLFKEQLLSMFDWGATQDYAKRQLSQAKAALRTGDYLRAIILFNEAAISAWVKDGSRVLDMAERELAEKSLFEHGGDTWHLLRRLRNSTAHDGEKNDSFEKRVKAMRLSRDGFEKGMREIVGWVERQCAGVRQN